MRRKRRTPSTRKVRRDVSGGKRGDGDKRTRAIRRPDPRRIHLGTPDPSLSGVAGLVLFGAYLRMIGVDQQLKRVFGSLKSSKCIYPMGAQLRLLLDAMVAGEPRVFGLEHLAADPLFVMLAGGVVPSLDTMYRDLDRFDEPDVEALSRMMVAQGLVPVRRLRHTEAVHLDIDTTVMPLFGQHEGAAVGPNPHYHGRPSYHPVVARVAETDTCVSAQLRPGDTSFGVDDVPFVELAIDRVREAIGPEPLLYVRIDAAGDCAELMASVERKRALFVTKARMTPDLCSAVAHHPRWRTTDTDADGEPSRQVATIVFHREQWWRTGLGIRVVAVRTRERDTGKQLCLWDDLDYTVQVYLTNDWQSDEDDIAWRYDKRAGIEPLIAEWKNAWGIGKMSSQSFDANAASLLLKLLAHNLLRRYVNDQVPRLRQWRTPWVRRALILVPGRITRSGRRRSLHLPRRPMLPHLLQ